MSYENVQKLVKDHAIEFVDLRFTDVRGVQHHVSFPVSIIEPALFTIMVLMAVVTTLMATPIFERIYGKKELRINN